jgi:hypothetical protein
MNNYNQNSTVENYEENYVESKKENTHNILLYVIIAVFVFISLIFIIFGDNKKDDKVGGKKGGIKIDGTDIGMLSSF